MPTTTARISHNTTVYYGTVVGTVTTLVPNVASVTGVVSIKHNIHDATNLTSPARLMEKIAGLKELPDITMTLDYVSEDTVHKALLGYCLAQTKIFFKFNLPDSAGAMGTTVSYIVGPFEALISNWNVNTN